MSAFMKDRVSMMMAAATDGAGAAAGAGDAGAGAAGDAGDAGDGGGKEGAESRGNGADTSGKAGKGQTPAELSAELDRARTALKEANAEAARRRKEVERFEGIDPAEFKRLKDLEVQREEESALAKGEYEKLRAALQTKVTDSERRAAEVQIRWDRSEICRDLLGAAASLGAIQQATARLAGTGQSQIEAFYADQFKVENGAVIHKTKLNEKGSPMSPIEFLTAEKEGSGANLFQSFLRSGTGSDGGGTGGSSDVSIKRNDPKKVQKFEEAQKAGKSIKFVD